MPTKPLATRLQRLSSLAPQALALALPLVLALTGGVSPALAFDQNRFEAAQERAALLDQVRNLLADESASVRLAVFEEVMKDDDPVLRSMALEAAFSGDDERLHTAGLRQLLKERDFLAVELIEPMDPSQPQAYTYNIWRELMLTDLSIDTDTDQVSGKFNSANSGGRFTGQLTRGGWRLQLKSGHYHCHLTLTELGGVDLMGSLNCAITSRTAGDDYAGGNRAALPFRIRLS
ncbi:hypothetical protein [Halomonas marinisediminis]|uniref:HEAT repeat domain-containing protein n=1 Tax=Halomonas marinisediminis TaxID=2546095 RepID=A0ABY2D381_9GAMM|nr:hypothetical protein [Halomonas marinisediminis]TDA95490.1 hypothetical protein E0702_15410 [Halomonas marinisediminis]